MKIIIINGSHRKNGATALILREMYQKLSEDIETADGINDRNIK